MTPKEWDAGAAVLGRAFTEYELLQYYFPDKKERRAAAGTFAFISLSLCLKYGEVYTASEKLEGVVAWWGYHPYLNHIPSRESNVREKILQF